MVSYTNIILLLLFLGCGDALGMKSKAIKDSQITASTTSVLYGAIVFAPYRARAGNTDNTRPWCADEAHQDKNQWLQIDLLGMTTLTAVATQGHWKRYTKSYYILYSQDGTSWATYKEDNVEKVYKNFLAISWYCFGYNS